MSFREILMRLTKQYALFVALLLGTLLAGDMAAQQPGKPTEKVLLNFVINYSAASGPSGGLISDAAGNFYGVTTGGGKGDGGLGYGTVFEMSPTAAGGWKPKSLYQFQAGTDGQNPVGGLLMDSSGNLYGTTQYGGTHLCTDGYDKFSCGTVFELSPNGVGGWSEKILYNFSQSDGYAPLSSLIMDSPGNLYGTTGAGGGRVGQGVRGTVFELRRTGEEWTELVLHRFAQTGDGASPSSSLIFDAAGNLYGETAIGGQTEGGTVFELSHTASGWQEQILFDFDTDGSGASGLQPNGGLIFDSAGNLYGTTFYGGIGSGYGTVFELTPTNGGDWNETVLYSFFPDPYNRCSPATALVFDASGNLYGTTTWGGSASSGSVFRLKASGGGAWTYALVHSFLNSSADGGIPDSNLLIDSKGNLYGTTTYGGTGGGGTVFEITP
jgi:uncharacterized repeat protein (TIGR03803 family)